MDTSTAQDPAHLGMACYRLVLAMVNKYTDCEVVSFARTKDTEGGLTVQK